MEKTASIECDVSGDIWRWWSHVASVSFWLLLSTGELTPCARGCPQALLFWATGSPLQYQVSASGLSESSESSSSWCDGFPRCFCMNPPRQASFSLTWEVDDTSNEFGHFFLLPSVLVSSSPSFWGNQLSWNSERSKESWNDWYWTNEEDYSTHHKWNYLWSTCLRFDVWILGSRFIQSNNQSRATLWVLDTCLIVGLMPLIVIFITTSLS